MCTRFECLFHSVPVGKVFSTWICGSGLFSQLCLTLATPWIVTHQAPLSMGFPRQERGCHFLLQWNLLNPGIELVLLNCRWILY